MKIRSYPLQSEFELNLFLRDVILIVIDSSNTVCVRQLRLLYQRYETRVKCFRTKFPHVLQNVRIYILC